jgi:hypothetical protein
VRSKQGGIGLARLFSGVELLWFAWEGKRHRAAPEGLREPHPIMLKHCEGGCHP